MNDTKKNFIYNLIYQILIMIIPLILSPYLSRTLGASGVGIYSYTYSIVYYFMLLTLLGVNNYGNRVVAKVRNNKEELSKSFWGIYTLQLMSGLLMIIVYYIYISMSNDKYKTIALIQSLFIISSIIDINWLFFGLEEFKKTITRNTIIKIISLLLIIIFVKKPEDTWKYTLIMSTTTILSQAVLWVFVPKYIKFTKIYKSDIVKHIKPNLILFIPVIAVSLYKIMDKIMLGAISNINEVAYYENAEKLVHVPLTLITALGTVMLPKMSNIIANGDKNKIDVYISKSISFVMFLSSAMCFGLISIGYDFAPIYFGQSFQKTGILIMLLAMTLPFLAFANVLRMQYLIPNEKDKEYIISVFLGAIINLIMNIILIPYLESIGACIGTIAAEFIVMFYQTFSVRKSLNVKQYISNILPFFIKAFIMFLIIYPMKSLINNSIICICTQVIVGSLIYFLLNIKYIKSIVDLKEYILNLKNKLNIKAR